MSTDQKTLTTEEFNFLLQCQFIRFDRHGKCHWVLYQRSKTLDRVERSRVMAMYKCIRCDAPTYVTENMPYCDACRGLVVAGENEWDREERLERAAEEKAAAELAKKEERDTEKKQTPRTWKEVSAAEKAAREAKKAKKKEVRKTLTLKDMLKQEDKKKTKSLKTMFSK